MENKVRVLGIEFFEENDYIKCIYIVFNKKYYTIKFNNKLIKNYNSFLLNLNINIFKSNNKRNIIEIEDNINNFKIYREIKKGVNKNILDKNLKIIDDSEIDIVDNININIIRAKYNNNKVVLKLINVDDDIKYMENEILVFNILKGCNNIVNFLGLYEEDGEIIGIVIEYCEKETLDEQENFSKEWALKIVEGVMEMHNRNIYHGDLNPKNIVINYNNEVKICDFGISNFLGSNQFKKSTKEWTAPEIIKYKLVPYDKGDIYSLGLILKTYFNISVEDCLNDIPDKRPNIKELFIIVKSSLNLE